MLVAEFLIPFTDRFNGAKNARKDRCKIRQNRIEQGRVRNRRRMLRIQFPLSQAPFLRCLYPARMKKSPKHAKPSKTFRVVIRKTLIHIGRLLEVVLANALGAIIAHYLLKFLP